MKRSIRQCTTGLLVSSVVSLGLIAVASAATASNDAAVTAAVASALKVTKMPAKTTPTLALVSADSFRKFNPECAAFKGSCTFGKLNSKEVMYIFGDSHAQQWLPPLVGAFGAKYKAEYKSESDHNGIKGYTGMYLLKAAIEKAGKIDRKAAAAAIRNSCFSAKQHPGILMDVCFDDKGDLDRESFLIEVKNGHPVINEVLPALSAKK
jgi:ABC-type branched-subunit amino acid transport system substrate-binding protein